MLQRTVRHFIELNTKMCLWLESRFHWQSDKPFWIEFEHLVTDTVAAVPAGGSVVDVGGGRRCMWAYAVPSAVHLIAIDIDPEELAANSVVQDRRVGDVSKGLPLSDGEADVIVTRALLEHVNGVLPAIDHMAAALKPGGRAQHFVPARNSLFGIVARHGPFKLLHALVHIAIPSSKGQVEFPTFYDHCTARDLEEGFLAAGFSEVDVRVCYAQSSYFYPFLPIYLLVIAYQFAVKRLGIRQLAAYLIVDAIR